jgi:hypothetical protein
MSFLAPIVGAIGSVFGGLFGGGEAAKAKEEQIAAEQQAQAAIQQSETQALGYNSNALTSEQGYLDPFVQSGQQASGTLSQMLSTPGQGLLTPWTQQFTAPTAEQAEATPGYQFQLQQGLQGVQNSAAAGGGLLSGGTLAAMNNYAQGAASTDYQNTFNNSLTQYQSAYQTFLNNQSNAYNMLSGQQNMGLNAASTLGGLTQSNAQTAGNITTGSGADIASLYGAQGAASAAGTIGQANAYSSILPGVAGSLAMMNLPNPNTVQAVPGGVLGTGSGPNSGVIGGPAATTPAVQVQ